MRASLLLLSPALWAACASTDAKGPEESVPDDLDGKLDSFHTPTDHGAIAFAAPQLGKLTAQQGFHTWELSLSDAAQLHAFTSRVPHYASVDTVLYLYKKQAGGNWGSYLYRNDDASSSTDFSSLSKSLGAGDYRVLVKGYSDATLGRFDVEVDCTGTGCAPLPPPPACLFGAFQGDFEMDANLLRNEQSFTSPTGMRPIDQQRAILAMHESAHTDVMTIEDAFAAADQGQIDFVRIYDLAGARSFTAVEYGAGDNPYGEIFIEETATEAAAIHDTDIVECTVNHATCLLGQNYGDLRGNPAWTETSHVTVTSAATLTALQQQQALAAIQVAYSDAATLAAGFASIDQHELDVRTFTHAATGTVVDAFDYGAGDNTYGELFAHGTTTTAALIHDSDFYACSVFAQ